MSRKGIDKAAFIFSQMQQLRIELIKGGDTQDILLGQMLGAGKDAMKKKFLNITLMPEGKIQQVPVPRRGKRITLQDLL